MIIRRETINEIATLRYAGKSAAYIAGFLNIAITDVREAIKTWKL